LAELNWTWWRIGDGAFFTEHKDIAVEDNKFGVRRIITAVYYFHRLPKAFSGGVLRIYPLAGSKNSTAFVDIEPTNDLGPVRRFALCNKLLDSSLNGRSSLPLQHALVPAPQRQIIDERQRVKDHDAGNRQ
jgi:hypothetical protein